MKTRLGICVFLIAITWIVFGQTLGHDFVNFDDKTYVYGNPVVTGGLTLRGIAWAFTNPHALNWHPLTTISHMLDCQLFGLNAGGHHFTNVLLHTIATLLLFLVLQDTTRMLLRSAFVAALFAIHPLRVESVAWVAERKDVLSAVFFMLTLIAYVRYTRHRTVGRYVLMSILFACGLMSKPMLVTLPFVLLLLDYWPLGRIRSQMSEDRGHKSEVSSQWFVVGGLIVEKIPLFIMSAMSCAATIVAQTGATGESVPLPLAWRLKNAVVSYAIYIWQMIWPSKLAIFYPTDSLSVWRVVLVIALLIAVTAVAIYTRKSRRYIFTGWFWYLGMLVPVIGLLQSGWQSHADRYTYLPHIGLYLAMVWTVADLLKTPNAERRTPNAKWFFLNWTLGSPLAKAFGVGRWALSVCFGFAILLLAWRAWDQTRYWKNTETLWTHTLAVTSNNDIAHHNYGLYLAGRGQLDEAISHYEAALRIRSGAEEVRYSLTSALVHNNLASALVRKGRIDEAITHYRKAIELRPDYADAYFNLGSAYLDQGRLDEAIEQWRKTLSIHPDDVEAHTTLGDALVGKRQLKEAISHYERALQVEPRSISTLNKLAVIASTSPDASLRNGPKAIELAQKADSYSEGKNPIVIRTLAAAYAEAGRFDDAIKTGERAAGLANVMGQGSLATMLEKDAELYREKSPLRDFNLTDAKASP